MQRAWAAKDGTSLWTAKPLTHQIVIIIIHNSIWEIKKKTGNNVGSSKPTIHYWYRLRPPLTYYGTKTMVVCAWLRLAGKIVQLSYQNFHISQSYALCALMDISYTWSYWTRLDAQMIHNALLNSYNDETQILTKNERTSSEVIKGH